MLVVNKIWPRAAQDCALQQNFCLQSQEGWVKGEDCWHHIVGFVLEGGYQH